MEKTWKDCEEGKRVRRVWKNQEVPSDLSFLWAWHDLGRNTSVTH